MWIKTGALGLAVLAGLTLFFALRKRVARLWFPPPAPASSRTTP